MLALPIKGPVFVPEGIGSATALSADTVLQMASSYGAKALNLQDIGTLNKE